MSESTGNHDSNVVDAGRADRTPDLWFTKHAARQDQAGALLGTARREWIGARKVLQPRIASVGGGKFVRSDGSPMWPFGNGFRVLNVAY